MATSGKAKAGRSGSSKNGLDADGLAPADGAAHAGRPETVPVEPEGDEHNADPFAQLFAQTGQFAAPQPSQFFPLETLKSRLGEFQQEPEPSEPPSSTALFKALPESAPSSESYRPDLAWFETRFGELRHLLTRQEDGKPELAALHEKLSGIESRLDRLSAQIPDLGAFAAMEERLHSLASSLEETRARHASNEERIAQAAAEILAASNSIQEERRRFEVAAYNTVEDLGQTVVATASRAAILTAGELAAGLPGEVTREGLARLEHEVRALRAETKENADKGAAAFDRVQETLRAVSGKVPGTTSSPARKRPSIHDPIYANSSIYNVSGLGVEIPKQHQLGTITLRNPTPSDPNFIKALEKAEAGLNRLSTVDEARQQAQAAETAPNDGIAASASDDDKRPVSGIAIVAIVLLLASAAIFYLQLKPQPLPLRLPDLSRQSVLPGAPALSGITAEANTDAVSGPAMPAVPSLFASSSPDLRLSAPTEEASLTEDLKVLEAAARHGDAEAQFRIGKRFLNDGQLEGGAATAARWLSRASEQGHIEATFMLASLYERGAGVSKDEERALTLYRKAATAGHVRAMHNLGAMMSERGTAAGYREAAFWFNRAAVAGLSDSQYNLALLYERGLGVEQDLSRAYFWYEVAAHAGDKEASQQAGRLKRSMPAGETAAAGAEAGSWHPTLEDKPRRAGDGAERRG